MAPATVHIVEDSGEARDLPVFLRGNVNRKGPVAERRFLRVLSGGATAPFKDGSGRRELAEAIADGGNPLTARVMVNRVWAQFFGQPLVATPSNFGHSGQPPTHPELLDDLAVRFMNQGWSVKSLVREMANSATYQQQALAQEVENRGTAHQGSEDSGNALLGHMNRRRLSIEQWRDAVLFVSGELNPAGGKSLELDDRDNCRRTVYARISRLKLNDLLMQFDYPDANVHAEKRGVTTTALQKLYVLNSPFMLERAKAFAVRLRELSPLSDSARVSQAYELLLGREPAFEESRLALEFLQKPAHGEASRWEQYAQLLLASNEMLYVD
jgi:hypothetical protein